MIEQGLPARQRLAPEGRAPRHRHAHGYAALVLAGDYVEAGDGGRRAVSPGDVILHGCFEAHANRFGRRGAWVLNLPLPDDWQPGVPFATVADGDVIARLAEADMPQAVACLLDQLAPAGPAPLDWPDILAADLSADDRLCLGDWARAANLAPGTVSRGFRQTYGASPARFRSEVRARRALRRLGETIPLAALAAETGFADQAHLTRAITALTGRTPGAWRRSNPFKTGTAARG